MQQLTDPHLAVRFVTNKKLTGVGTCFAIAENYFMTALHVVKNANDLQISDAMKMENGEKTLALIDAKIVWKSSKFDLAIITPNNSTTFSKPNLLYKLSTAGIPFYNTNLSSFGYPLPELQAASEQVKSLRIRAFTGTLTSTCRIDFIGYPNEPMLETAFPILHGMSGAPVYSYTDLQELHGICLGASEFYTEERQRIEQSPDSNKVYVTESGWRFGLCLDLFTASQEEPEMLNYFSKT